MKTHRFKILGHDYETKVIRRDWEEMVISVNGQEYEVILQPSKARQSVKPMPKMIRPVAIPSEGTKVTASPAETKGAGVVKAPMPGLIIKVEVKEGDTVKAGQSVLTMEAMKMQSPVSSAIDGKVVRISVKDGESVLEGQELVLIG